MDFIHYLKFKFKLDSSVVKKRPSSEVYAERSVLFILGTFLSLIIYFILKLVSKNILTNINMYIVYYYVLLLIITMSISIQKYYKEYFESLEREIILVAPIKQNQIALARLFLVSVETLVVFTFFYLPLIFAAFLAKGISFEVLLISIITLICLSLFESAFAHIIFSIAFLISGGKSLKIIAYSIMIFFTSMFTMVSYFYRHKIFNINLNNINLNNICLKIIFYPLLKYPQLILLSNISMIETVKFIISTIGYVCVFFIAAYKLTLICYKKGLLSISSRDLEKSLYFIFITKVFTNITDNGFLRKDILCLVRSPKVFAAYINPIIIIILITFKINFLTKPLSLPIYISTITIIINIVTLTIIQSDDSQHKDLLLIIPFDSDILIKNRSKLLFIISSIISILSFVCTILFNFITWKKLIFSFIQILIMCYIASKSMQKNIVKYNIKKTGSYRYDGYFGLTVMYYIFCSAIPQIILFTILFKGFNI
jgi:hypothetical protein